MYKWLDLCSPFLFIKIGKSKLRLIRISTVEINDGQAKRAPGKVVAHIADVKTQLVEVRMEISLDEIFDITLKSRKDINKVFSAAKYRKFNILELVRSKKKPWINGLSGPY